MKRTRMISGFKSTYSGAGCVGLQPVECEVVTEDSLHRGTDLNQLIFDPHWFKL